MPATIRSAPSRGIGPALSRATRGDVVPQSERCTAPVGFRCRPSLRCTQPGSLDAVAAGSAWPRRVGPTEAPKVSPGVRSARIAERDGGDGRPASCLFDGPLLSVRATCRSPLLALVPACRMRPPQALPGRAGSVQPRRRRCLRAGRSARVAKRGGGHGRPASCLFDGPPLSVRATCRSPLLALVPARRMRSPQALPGRVESAQRRHRRCLRGCRSTWAAQRGDRVRRVGRDRSSRSLRQPDGVQGTGPLAGRGAEPRRGPLFAHYEAEPPGPTAPPGRTPRRRTRPGPRPRALRH